ncbi:efflux RND transporter periplasmic adaptor subunit [Saccharicrinis fermentans]|uniref:Efflux pump periplasmic linker BepF n=1 Tax=Saccharicrinis fermentans DSM 9555 = JCM 21142 TaxID=869213 RepID=W7YD18_9BACT|nr:efflux RND transporter periplasmic adaptor subunit [Saccharicrinis fermentans]GAF02356.1 efflux pump periplasmic linker BepF [Saccharicrinis fermentans DSM 9555 = JCM 21142]
MNQSKLFMLVTVVAIILHGCGSHETEESNKAGALVKTSQVRASEVPKTYQYSGTIAAVKKSTISTRIMGQIDQIYAHEGDRVEKGQLLLAIRSNDIMAKKSQVEAGIIEADAAYKNAERDYNRISNLYKQASATQKELDDVSMHFNMAKARLEVAQKAKAEVEEMMTYAHIRAPYAGVITNLFVDAGDMANPGLPLLAVEALGEFEVMTRIPESEIDLVSKGDTVYIALKSCETNIKGFVSRVSSSSILSGAQFEVRISLLPTKMQEKALRSGMFAQVKLRKGSNEKIMISKDLIVNRGQLTGVWTVGESQAALLRWVRLGKSDANQVEVLSGLSEGDLLIVECQERLYDGMAVRL